MEVYYYILFIMLQSLYYKSIASYVSTIAKWYLPFFPFRSRNLLFSW